MSEYTRPIYFLLTRIARSRGITLPRYTGTDYPGFNRQMFETVLAPAMGLRLPNMDNDADYRERQTYVLLRRLAHQALPAAETDAMPVLPSVTFSMGGGAELPVVSFTQLTHPSIVESATANDIIISLTVENPLTATLVDAWHVDLTYTSPGGAAYETDFRIFQVISGQTIEASTRVDFAPFQTNAFIILRVEDDGSSEALETWKIQLVPNAGCTIGSIGETSGDIIDDDVMGGGEALRPEFVFASEVFGKGPNALADNRANMVADLGPNVTFTHDVHITVAAYSPSSGLGAAVESTDGGLTGDYWFPNGKILTIEAGDRFGTLEFQALPSGVASSMKWVVVEMISTTYGEVGLYPQHCRWTAVLCGAADVKGLAPVPTVPSTSLDDYKVYANRIEDIVHGVTIPLPYDRNATAALLDGFGQPIYGTLATQLNGGNLYNGLAIAAHLAQKVWLARNGGSFGVRKVFVTGFPGEDQMHYIEPAVKWLDKGVPVYISVYEDAANGPHPLEFAGGHNQGYTSHAIGTVIWGRNISIPGYPQLHHPGMTRDLYITSRNHNHKISRFNSGLTQVEISTPVPGENWYTGCFVDNLQMHGLRIFSTNVSAPAGDWTQKCIKIQGARYMQRPAISHGIMYFDSWVWDSEDYLTNPLFDRMMRFNGSGSYFITRCTFTRAALQSTYFDSTGPICVHYENTVPVGSGLALLQLTSRPALTTPSVASTYGGNNAGPSHGLVALVNNEVVSHNGWSTGSDLELYGHLGYLFVVGTRHRGDAGHPGQTSPPIPVNNHRLTAVLATGNGAGLYVASAETIDLAQPFLPDTPTNSPQDWFAFRYVEISEMDVDLDGTTGSWFSSGVAVSGCYRFVFNPVLQASSALAMGGRPFISFNENMLPRYDQGAVLSDPLLRAVAGGGHGPEIRLPNRGGVAGDPPGGIKFPVGFAEAIGSACGSTPKAYHPTFQSNFTQTIHFSDRNAMEQDLYDGRDF